MVCAHIKQTEQTIALEARTFIFFKPKHLGRTERTADPESTVPNFWILKNNNVLRLKLK